MVSYSEYVQAKRIINNRQPNEFVKKMCRKTITAFKKQLRAENDYVKH